MAGCDGSHSTVREGIVVPLLNRPFVQRWATRLASQLWVTYRRGPLGGSRFGRSPRSGDRVLDLECRRADGTTTRLYAELGGRWALLTSDAAAAQRVPAWFHDHLEFLTPVQSQQDSMLVRPDGHLAWRGNLATNGIRQWLQAATSKGRTR